MVQEKKASSDRNTDGLSPVVSVVVVNLNRRELLHRCLLSLDAQTASGFEVIVIDNGSTDGSGEMLNQVVSHLRFPLQVIQNVANLGFCGGNNQGIRRARGEYIALLNNDAEADSGWIAAMLESLRSRPEFGMAACKILVHENPRKIDKVGHLIFLDGQNRGRGSGELDLGQYEIEEEILWPDGCAAMYRRAMLDEIGIFDEDLFAYGDDAELGLRARIAGWRCIYVPRAVVRHHRASTLGLLSGRRIELIERNRLLLAVKHFPVGLLCLNGLFWSVRVGAGVIAALRGRGEAGKFKGATGLTTLAAALIRGNLQALRLIPATLRKRRALRPIRRLSSREVRTLLLAHRIPLKTLSEQTV
ncbi:MAG TPA: glycosyltransferase family 2 protein [Bryobacteraceae bacterium]|nr:glycosyltransferase family 2 protein [Bryobacteraceae bacterium]